MVLRVVLHVVERLPLPSVQATLVLNPSTRRFLPYVS